MRARLSLIPVVLVLSLGALIAACNGGEEESGGGPASATTAPLVSGTSTPSGSTIASPVGDVVVSLPPGSDITGGSVEISTLPAVQWPSELSVVEAQLVVQIGPDGAQFDEPVTVTLKLAAVDPTDIADVFLITRNPDGSWESLADITTKIDGTAVLVSGTTTHFSPFAAGIQAAGAVAHERVSVASADNSESPTAPDEQVQTLPPLPGLPPPAEPLPQDILPGFERMQEAIDNQDPQILIDSTKPGPERDRILALYAWTALDLNALDQIVDPRVHDGTLIGIVSVAYGRLSVAPGASYCDMLRGGYEYDADNGLPEEELILNRVICNQVVAATNELVFGGDDCESHVEATFESNWDEDDPFYTEDKQDSKDSCKAMVVAMRDLEGRIASVETPEELLDIMKEIEHVSVDGESASCDYSGVYSTNWGEMTIRHSAASITADYTHDVGRLDGSLNGNVLRGQWYEAPSYAGPGDAGPLEFTFGEDCASFSGVWAYESTPSGWVGDWAGNNTRVRDVPLPQSGLGDPADAKLNDAFSGSSDTN